MSEKKLSWQQFWQLWKDTLALLATIAIVLYFLNAILHSFDAATMTRLVQAYQIIGVIVFVCSLVIITVSRWLYERCKCRQTKIRK